MNKLFLLIISFANFYSLPLYPEPHNLPFEKNNNSNLNLLFDENVGLWHRNSNSESIALYNNGPEYRQLIIQLDDIINKTTNFAFSILLNSDIHLTS